MTKAITIAYKISHQYKERIFAILVAAILLTAFAYVFLLQRAIVNVVERQKVSQETKALSVKVGGLEEKYFSIKNTITLDLAHSKGLKDAQDISYISKKAVTAMALPHEI
jgi:hypothetical protein